MVICYAWAEGIGTAAARRYRELYPNRDRFPDSRVIVAACRRMREGELVPRRGVNGGRAATLRTPALEEQIIGILERDPCTSLRVVARQMDISQSTVNRITRSEHLRPYHLNPVQELREHDAPIRVNFSDWLLTECERDPRFLDKLIVTDEAPFTQFTQ